MASEVSDAEYEEGGEEEAYREVVDTIVEKWREQESATFDLCYGIGEAVNTLKGDARRYGKGKVERFADALNLDSSTLYANALVAEYFTRDDIEDIATNRAKTEATPLGWTHVQILATVADGRVRRSLVRGVSDDGWSIRDLKAKKAEKLAGGEDESSAQLTKSLNSALSNVVARAEKCLGGRAWPADGVDRVQMKATLEAAKEKIDACLQRLTRRGRRSA